MAAVVIRIGRSRTRGRMLDRRRAGRGPRCLQLVGELDHQDAVLGDQPDQGDEPDLGIDVERGRARRMSGSSAPKIDIGTRPG